MVATSEAPKKSVLLKGMASAKPKMLQNQWASEDAEKVRLA